MDRRSKSYEINNYRLNEDLAESKEEELQRLKNYRIAHKTKLTCDKRRKKRKRKSN